MAVPTGYGYQQVMDFIEAGTDLTKLTDALLGNAPKADVRAKSLGYKKGTFFGSGTRGFDASGLLADTPELQKFVSALSVIYSGRKQDFNQRRGAAGVKDLTSSNITPGNNQGKPFEDFNYTTNKSLLG